MHRGSSFLRACHVCPRRCGTDRLGGDRGFCGAGATTTVAYYGPHFGEEPPLSGTGGSGTIFFSPCNLRCLYCQNFQISHVHTGQDVTTKDLVGIFFELENLGCHNINLVTPTPYAPLLADAMGQARARGLAIPFVYNTNAYETVETLEMLDGLVDIYLPDFKYWNDAMAVTLSSAPEYRLCASNAISEMYRQVGILTIKDGIATRGVLIRHLVLPGGLAGSRKVLRWIGDTWGRDAAISLMSQYLPLYRAAEFPIINRTIREGEYTPLVAFAEEEGFSRLFLQHLESASAFVPDFDNDEPFVPEQGKEA